MTTGDKDTRMTHVHADTVIPNTVPFLISRSPCRFLSNFTIESDIIHLDKFIPTPGGNLGWRKKNVELFVKRKRGMAALSTWATENYILAYPTEKPPALNAQWNSFGGAKTEAHSITSC